MNFLFYMFSGVSKLCMELSVSRSYIFASVASGRVLLMIRCLKQCLSNGS